jgi:anti-sigma B factor antagonist
LTIAGSCKETVMADYRRLKISEVLVTVVQFTDKQLTDAWVNLADASLQDPRSQIHEIMEEFDRLLSEGRKHLILNFANVEFVSTTMQGELLQLRQKVVAANGTLTLTNINPITLEMFKIPMLDKVFNIRKDQADALPSL